MSSRNSCSSPWTPCGRLPAAERRRVVKLTGRDPPDIDPNCCRAKLPCRPPRWPSTVLIATQPAAPVCGSPPDSITPAPVPCRSPRNVLDISNRLIKPSSSAAPSRRVMSEMPLPWASCTLTWTHRGPYRSSMGLRQRLSEVDAHHRPGVDFGHRPAGVRDRRPVGPTFACLSCPKYCPCRCDLPTARTGPGDAPVPVGVLACAARYFSSEWCYPLLSAKAQAL